MLPDSSGSKKRSSESNLEVDIHDGEDGGIVMDVIRRHRGKVRIVILFCQWNYLLNLGLKDLSTRSKHEVMHVRV